MDVNVIPGKRILHKKVLVETDVKHQYIAKNDLLLEFPIGDGEYHRDIVVYDRNGVPRKFILTIRQTGDYTKPYFQKQGWHEFVKDYGLGAGDGVIFYRDIQNPQRVEVRGMKLLPSPLMGQAIWFEAPLL